MVVAFWDVDTQYDFMKKDGKLYVANAEDIIPNLKALTDCANKNKILILGSVDNHFPEDSEMSVFPVHCMKGTLGQDKIPETLKEECFYVINRPDTLKENLRYSNGDIITIVKCYEKEQIIFEKQTTDVFTNKNADKFLDKFNIDTIIVYGVATDYCVKAAVKGLLKRKYKVYVVEDAIKGIDFTDTKNTLKFFEKKGVIFVETKDVLRYINGGWGKE